MIGPERFYLFAGDNRDLMANMGDNTVDSVVTDGPYELVSIRKRFGGPNAAPQQFGTDGAYARAARGGGIRAHRAGAHRSCCQQWLTALSFPHTKPAKGYKMSEKVATRNSAVLEAAVALASERGHRKFSRSDVAARAGVAAGSVNNAFATMDLLHDAVMQAAVDRRIAPLIAEGLAARHPIACAAPQDAKDSALAALAA